MKVEKTIDINAAPERVWPYCIEPAKILKWCITFQKFVFTGEQQSGTGTPLYIEEDAGTGLMKMKFRVTEWTENEKISLQMISGAGLKAYEQSWILEPSSTGSRFKFTEILIFPFGIIGKLIGSIAEKMSAATVEKMLIKIKALAEA